MVKGFTFTRRHNCHALGKLSRVAYKDSCHNGQQHPGWAEFSEIASLDGLLVGPTPIPLPQGRCLRCKRKLP